MSDWLKDKVVRPRKSHRCCWCGEWCIVGEKAHYRAYKFDGAFQTDYMHPECREALAESDIGCDGFDFGEMKRGKTMEESDI